MRFEWDERKNALNLERHDLRFETALLVFDDPYVVTLRDGSHDEEEERFITLGAIGAGVVVFVVHTSFEVAGEEVIRLISARAASSAERKIYETAHKRATPRHRRHRREKRRRY
jgi:uncharacterized protein